MIAATAFLGCATVGLAPGCGSALGPVTVRDSGSKGKPRISAHSIERLQGCMAEFGWQLDAKVHLFSPIIEVDRDGVKHRITADDIPTSAYDFAGCTRAALADMPIPDGILDIPRMEATTTGQRSYIGSPALVVVVIVGLSEIALEAGAYTIMFAVTVKVVEKAKDDVAELAKRKRDKPWEECLNRYEACVASSLYGEEGKHIKDSRCSLCLGICRAKGTWPAFVDTGRCL